MLSRLKKKIHVYIIPEDRETWENPEAGGMISFKASEHQNGLVVSSL
jgi:hypothetical protein